MYHQDLVTQNNRTFGQSIHWNKIQNSTSTLFDSCLHHQTIVLEFTYSYIGSHVYCENSSAVTG